MVIRLWRSIREPRSSGRIYKIMRRMWKLIHLKSISPCKNRKRAMLRGAQRGVKAKEGQEIEFLTREGGGTGQALAAYVINNLAATQKVNSG
jgi:hypothetical protein